MMPRHFLRTRWVPLSVLGGLRHVAEGEAERCKRAPGWNPKTLHLKGKLHLVDVCGDKARVAYLRDHRALDGALKNAPRAAKSIYRKSVRLKHFRADEAWDVIADMDRAWVAYNKWQGRVVNAS